MTDGLVDNGSSRLILNNDRLIGSSHRSAVLNLRSANH